MNQRPMVMVCTALLILTSACASQTNKRPAGEVTVQETLPPIRLSTENTDAAEPVIAAGRGGAIYAAWVEHGPHKDANLMFAQLDANGQMKGPPVRVNPRAGEATAWRGDPPTMAIATDGTVYVGWTARVGAQGHAHDLYLSASRDEGKTFAPPVKVNDDTKPAARGMHSLAVSADGRIYLAWLDERHIVPPVAHQKSAGHQHVESNREVFTAYSADGGRTFSSNQRIANEACPCCKTSLAVAPDGRLFASWRQVLPDDFRHIAVASSADGGQTFASPVIVSDDRWQIAGCPVSGSALTVSRDGTLQALWYAAGEGDQPGIYWSESRDGGRSFAPRQLLAAGQTHGTPVSVLHENGRLVAVWESSETDSARTMLTTSFPPDGHRATSKLMMDNAELPSAAASGHQLFIAYISKIDDRRSIWLIRERLYVKQTKMWNDSEAPPKGRQRVALGPLARCRFRKPQRGDRISRPVGVSASSFAPGGALL